MINLCSFDFFAFIHFFVFSYQDAIAVCRKYHKPDYFITFTCNPLWVEILPHQTASTKPDIVVRVFRLKLRSLIDDLRYKVRDVPFHLIFR